MTDSAVSAGGADEELEVAHSRLPSVTVDIPSGEVFVTQIEGDSFAFSYFQIDFLESFQDSGRFFGEFGES